MSRDLERGRVPWGGFAVGAAVAVPILSPPSWETKGLLFATLPQLIAGGVLIASIVLGGHRLRITRLTFVFVILISCGHIGGLITGTLSDQTTIRMTALILLWMAAGGLSTDASRRIGRRSISDRDAANIVIVGVGIVVALICIAEVVRGAPLLMPQAFREVNPLTGSIRAQATTPYPLLTGFVLLATLLVLLGTSSTGRTRVLAGAPILLGIVATGSASAAAVAGVAVIYALLARRASGTKLLSYLTLAVCAAFAAVLSPSVASLLDEFSPEANAHRLNSIRAVPNLIGGRPLDEVVFGSGWSSVRLLFDRGVFENDGFFAVDNQFISILAFAGVVGFICYAVIVVAGMAFPRHREAVAPFVFVTVMGLSFDTLSLATAAALWVYVTTWALGAPAPESRDRRRREATVFGPGGTAYSVYVR